MNTQKIKALLIPGIILLPMLIAMMIFYTGIGFPKSTSNKGELLQPAISVTELPVFSDSQFFNRLYGADEKRWRMLIPVNAECLEACQNNLYLSRQVHIRLAQKAYRVERIIALTDELSSDRLESLKQEHPSTQIISVNQNDLGKWLGATQITELFDHFYLIDQEGFAMMAYSEAHSGQDVLSDLKKLLKYTYSQ